MRKVLGGMATAVMTLIMTVGLASPASADPEPRWLSHFSRLDHCQVSGAIWVVNEKNHGRWADFECREDDTFGGYYLIGYSNHW